MLRRRAVQRTTRLKPMRALDQHQLHMGRPATPLPPFPPSPLPQAYPAQRPTKLGPPASR